MSRIDCIEDLRTLNHQNLKYLGGTRIAYVGGSSIIPIVSKEQLDKSVIYSEIKNKGFKDSLIWDKESISNIKNRDFKYKESRKLYDLLLSFGGNDVILNEPEEDIENILKYGQFWFGKSAKIMKGQPCQCHKNSCDLWNSDNNKDYSRICTGYALSQDGLWRQHSWILYFKTASNQIIETTVKRVAYFGFIMDEDTANNFCKDN